MIKEFEFYHGVVFSKLIHEVEVPVKFTVYPTASNASYVLNDTIGIYIKHSAKRMTPWRFSMQRDHQDEILKMKNDLGEVFLVLVCGDDGIVTLNFEELKTILNEAHGNVEWISAARRPREEYTIKGSDGSLDYKVAKIDFGKKISDAVKTAPSRRNSSDQLRFTWTDQSLQ